MAIKKTSQMVVQQEAGKTKKVEPNAEAVKNFIKGADKVVTGEGGNDLDPDATRSFRQLSVRLNEYEFRFLEKYSKKVRRTIADSLREALIEKIKAENGADD